MLSRLFAIILGVSFSVLFPLYGKEMPATPSLADQATWEGAVFRIEDAKSRVSIASVKLSVGDLKPENGILVGEYTIEVPLMESKNDQGKIVLPLHFSMDDLKAKGGVLRGKAISHKEGKKVNSIVCEIIPGKDQKILLDITTDDRTIKFKSNYSIVKTAEGS